MSTFYFIIVVATLAALGGSIGCSLAYEYLKKKEENTPIIEILPDEESQTASAREGMEGEYTGILHISKGKHNFERPVMVKKYRGRDVYFEYNEEGEQILLAHNKKLAGNIAILLEDHSYKCRSLKWYPISDNK